MTGFNLPLNATHYILSLTACDKHGKPLALYHLSKEASAVIKEWMQSEEGSTAINNATAIDKEPGT